MRNKQIIEINQLPISTQELSQITNEEKRKRRVVRKMDDKEKKIIFGKWRFTNKNIEGNIIFYKRIEVQNRRILNGIRREENCLDKRIIACQTETNDHTFMNVE